MNDDVPTGFFDRCEYEIKTYDKLSYKSSCQLLARSRRQQEEIAKLKQELDDYRTELLKLQDIFEAMSPTSRKLAEKIASNKKILLERGIEL